MRSLTVDSVHRAFADVSDWNGVIDTMLATMSESAGATQTVRAAVSVTEALSSFSPAPVVPLAAEPPARLIVDAPLPEQLTRGYVVVRYHAEHARIMPVYGEYALGVTPRLAHLHVTLDDLPWHWLDASGEPLSINGLPPGPHKLLIELQDPTHKLIDAVTIRFEVPQPPATPK